MTLRLSRTDCACSGRRVLWWMITSRLSLALSPYLSLTCVHITTTTTTKPIDASSWLLIKRSRKMKIQITLSGLLSRMCWTTISGKVQKWQPFFVLGTLTCTQMDMGSSILSLLWSQLNSRINKFISREKVIQLNKTLFSRADKKLFKNIFM